MLNLNLLKETRAYQEAKEEGKEEGKLETKFKMIPMHQVGEPANFRKLLMRSACSASSD